MTTRYEEFRKTVAGLNKDDLIHQLYLATSEAKAERERADQEKRNHKTVRSMLNEEQVAHSITKDRENKLLEAYEHAYNAIYAQHCTLNHMENTEHENGQISGLIQASNILQKAFASLYPESEETK